MLFRSVDDDGVTFKSHLDGSMHRFTPEISMQVQHQIGADIMFAFDECTTLLDSREYQEQSLVRTHEWAQRCVQEHQRLTRERSHRPYQALFGVIQGAQYEDLRKKAASDLGSLHEANTEFDGFGIGGALDDVDERRWQVVFIGQFHAIFLSSKSASIFPTLLR
mgnify:CR=1 FL=1